ARAAVGRRPGYRSLNGFPPALNAQSARIAQPHLSTSQTGTPMPLDPYVSCPCGSGKKFKWCCAPFYPQVEKAFEQERVGQHEAALQTIRELTQSHADQPAVWGYLAQFLYNSAGVQREQEIRVKMGEE